MTDDTESDSTDEQPVEYPREPYDHRKRRNADDKKEFWRDKGTGSGDYTDEVIDRDAVDDGHESKAKTTFYERDVDDKGILRSDGSRVTYRQLWFRHIGHDPHSTPTEEYDEMDRRSRRKHLIGVFDLELTSLQRERVENWILEIDLTDGGRRSEPSVVAAAVSLACGADFRWIQQEDEFRDLMNEFDISKTELQHARQYLREKVDRIEDISPSTEERAAYLQQ